MANPTAILNKVLRNMEQRGYWNPGNPNGPAPASGVQIALVGSTIELTQVGGAVLNVTYVPKAVQSPMGGVDPTVSPYLGIGIGAPGLLQLQPANPATTTIPGIFTDQSSVELMVELSGYANDLQILGGTGGQLALIHGMDSWLGLGS